MSLQYRDASLRKFQGKWIVLCGKQIVSSGSDIKKVVAEAKRNYPNKKLLLERVPDEGMSIF